jgi:hypothetical protein
MKKYKIYMLGFSMMLKRHVTTDYAITAFDITTACYKMAERVNQESGMIVQEITIVEEKEND